MADKSARAREARSEWFGDAPSTLHVLLASAKLLADIGEIIPVSFDPPSFRANDLKNGLEEVLHELAHHVALCGEVDFTRKWARSSITRRIADMTPATRAGNEMDTLAIQLEAMWWLYHPYSQTTAAREALAADNFDIHISRRALNNALTHLRADMDINCLGAGLALVIYEEIERQKREGFFKASELPENA
jgi:hypothetical protein